MLIELRKQLKQQIEELKLFTPKFNRHVKFTPEFVEACFLATPGCDSPEFKDRLYWIINDIYKYRTCNTCKKPIEEMIKDFSSHYKTKQHCNRKCRMSDKVLRKRWEDARLLRTGYKTPLENPEVWLKIKATNMERTGYENPLSNPAAHEKRRETSFIKYGVRHPMQNYEVFQRSMKARFQVKTYKGRDGSARYQGYEDVALRYFHETLAISMDDITCDRGEMPKIFYINSEKRFQARYYPDIYIKAINLIIEVKSWYTYNMKIIETHEKQAACKQQGYNHIILICDKKHILKVI